MPFMAVLANPQLVETNAILSAAFHILGFSRPQDFLYFLGAMVFVVLLISLVFKALATYAQLRFSFSREYTIGKRLIEGYLNQPYVWFLNRHSADLGKTVLSEVAAVISGGMVPLITLFAQSAVAIALLLLLLLANPLLALSSGLVLSAAYWLIFKKMGGLLSRLGSNRFETNQQRFTAVSEAFSAVKEVKIGGLENAYVQRFAQPAEIYARNQASAQVIAQMPRFALEAIAFGGMLLVVLYLIEHSGSFAAALPIITLYAFAGYRLIPALQQVYASSTQLRFAEAAIDALHGELVKLSPIVNSNNSIVSMLLEKEIVLNNIIFKYPKAAEPTLKGINLTIPAFSTVALVGATGCGKTTTVDLILGLLEPQEGALLVDGQPINVSNRRQWQKTIGYVPQQIYLSDDSVAANIAFGVEPRDIDLHAVERAAKIANLHSFVTNDLPQSYATSVGERGVRLSGGQRQRIGIARALYHNPQILILDEATSALDNLTEQAVMEAVNNLGHEITIILIAHRLSTVRQCDLVFLLEKGEVKAQGNFEQLTQADETFRAMASL